MIEMLTEKPLAEIKAEAEAEDLKKGVVQMLLATMTQMGETIESMEQRIAALEKK